MSTASPAALDAFLNRYTAQVGGGFATIAGDVHAIFSALVVISLGLSGLLWALDENQNVPAALIRKILLIGFFAWLISGWHDMSLTVVNGFAALGLKAGGGALSVGDLMHSPSKVIIDGLKVAFALLKYIGKLASEGMGVGFFTHIDAILVTALAAVGIILAFAVLGIHLAVTIIEFYIVTLIGFVTVPFGILTQTAFLSERAIGYVVAIGVKVMAMAIVVSIGETLFASYIVSAEPDWSESCGLLIAALAFCMLGFRIPSVAAALITGGPQLSAGAAASAAVGVAATVGGAALAGRWAAGGAGAGTAASAARGAAGLRARLGAIGGASGAQGGASGAGPSGGGSPPGAPSAPSPPGGGSAGGSGGGQAGDGASPAAGPGPSPGPDLSGVVARAKASFSPAKDDEAPSEAGPGSTQGAGAARRTRARRGAAGVAGAPWRGQADDGPAGMPQIHPPSDDD
ncbi:P-type conjugative transfer protein TrbL [Caulobacter hibisci]|uniref:P-type conjugative transfer protein TrbL n=1 Tax=Caulobacter hibisci TaxID=2035993 RepID=A0ABS0SX39_9CAUL|nr:P-type conjugative transfer protein TrbL [Caulobacter hibisci]MBI1684207.1 P-type conjugative transfer protein TrbL [Caulobacter hibisci]